MTRQEAIKDLVKFLIIACITTVVFLLLTGTKDFSSFLLFFFMVGGIPAGWKWSSNIITAVGLYGIIIKLMMSLILGWFAFAYTIIKDVYFIIVNKQSEQSEE